MGWQWHQLDHMQMIAPCSSQISMPARHHSMFHNTDALPDAQPTVSKHWRLGSKFGTESSLKDVIACSKVCRCTTLWHFSNLHRPNGWVFLCHPLLVGLVSVNLWCCCVAGLQKHQEQNRGDLPHCWQRDWDWPENRQGRTESRHVHSEIWAPDGGCAGHRYPWRGCRLW